MTEKAPPSKTNGKTLLDLVSIQRRIMRRYWNARPRRESAHTFEPRSRTSARILKEVKYADGIGAPQ
ncbi:hypothetical protein PUNSTDRAFT_136715 [Punctularia strigosozonata HHB-11173 SS5]|uniref:uncharacterized protein n=1 Tax=Punctularia strigosozonata (strain HHB-11173) TaxID=741275 RepID=UPI00044163F1|nr:uncharacterized protein PUNSTDRAFT_136715 [Punctularia strigosozonata HHB-11173 SS5]EIN06896.1 hypothetical protein PUNSTDRAFT_136715 [Punctularia strigosozonata HHB-11173 SS5]